MKKRLNINENESKRILDLHKNAIIQEQITTPDKRMAIDNTYVNQMIKPFNPKPTNYGFQTDPYSSQNTYNMAGFNQTPGGFQQTFIDGLNKVSQNITTTTTTAKVVTTTTTVKKVITNTDAVNLQKELNSKFQAGLKEDGKVGPLTIAATLKALGGDSAVTQTTTQTTTLAPLTGTETSFDNL